MPDIFISQLKWDMHDEVREWTGMFWMITIIYRNDFKSFIINKNRHSYVGLSFRFQLIEIKTQISNIWLILLSYRWQLLKVKEQWRNHKLKTCRSAGMTEEGKKSHPFRKHKWQAHKRENDRPFPQNENIRLSRPVNWQSSLHLPPLHLQP